jgi:hypothetical protein
MTAEGSRPSSVQDDPRHDAAWRHNDAVLGAAGEQQTMAAFLEQFSCGPEALNNPRGATSMLPATKMLPAAAGSEKPDIAMDTAPVDSDDDDGVAIAPPPPPAAAASHVIVLDDDGLEEEELEDVPPVGGLALMDDAMAQQRDSMRFDNFVDADEELEEAPPMPQPPVVAAGVFKLLPHEVDGGGDDDGDDDDDDCCTESGDGSATSGNAGDDTVAHAVATTDDGVASAGQVEEEEDVKPFALDANHDYDVIAGKTRFFEERLVL